MKRTIILLVILMTIMSCEKEEIAQPENIKTTIYSDNVMFIYDAISNYRNDINNKFTNNGYTQTDPTIFFNNELQIKAFVIYESGDEKTEEVLYIINKTDYNKVITELNLELTVEISDSIWHETSDCNNIWTLMNGIELYKDQYILITKKIK